jgi:hypothetical protein
MARNSSTQAVQKLLTALACGATVEQAARKAGLSERTVYRRLADPAFRKQVQQVHNEIVRRTAGLLTGAALGSVKTLADLQQDAAVPATVRRTAARDILELGLKLREAINLEERLATVEGRVARAIGGGQTEPAPDHETFTNKELP